MEENSHLHQVNTFYEINTYEGGSNQTLSFKPETYHQIQEEKEELSINKIFKTKWFDRNKEIRYIAQKHENIIDINSVNGKARINLITDEIIKREMNKLSNREAKRYKNIYFGGIEFTIKAYFQKNINTPIQIYILDDRILDNIQDALISVVRGNLIYQKLKFTIQPDFSISLEDKHKELALTLYYKLDGINMPYGSKVLSIETKMIYALTGNHHVRKQHELDILVPKLYKEILEPLEHKDYAQITIPEEICMDFSTREIRPIKKVIPKIENARLRFTTELVNCSRKMNLIELQSNILKIKVILFTEILPIDCIAEISKSVKSIIHINKVNKNKCTTIEPKTYICPNNSKEIIVDKLTNIRLKIQDLEYDIVIGVTEYNSNFDLILGYDFLNNINYEINHMGIKIQDQGKIRFINKI